MTSHLPFLSFFLKHPMERNQAEYGFSAVSSQPLYLRSNNSLRIWDYSVVGLLLVVSAFFGIYYGVIRRKQNSSQDSYFLGDRQLSIGPVAMSLMATFFSALTLVRTPLSNSSMDFCT